MKTLKIALASALIVFSLNSFAGTCSPCATSENIIIIESEVPNDAKVNDLLQKMTVAVQKKVTDSAVSNSKKHKHAKRKARS